MVDMVDTMTSPSRLSHEAERRLFFNRLKQIGRLLEAEIDYVQGCHRTGTPYHVLRDGKPQGFLDAAYMLLGRTGDEV